MHKKHVQLYFIVHLAERPQKITEIFILTPSLIPAFVPADFSTKESSNSKRQKDSSIIPDVAQQG